MIFNNLAVLNPCEIETIDQALCKIVDRELVDGNKLSPGAVWCDDVATHHLRITALDGNELHPRRIAVCCRSCETAMPDETLQLRDLVCQHLRDSLGRQEPTTLARLARWTRFVQGVSIQASHGGPAPIRTRLEVVLRWTGDIVVRAFMDVEDAREPWSAPRHTWRARIDSPASWKESPLREPSGISFSRHGPTSSTSTSTLETNRPLIPTTSFWPSIQFLISCPALT